MKIKFVLFALAITSLFSCEQELDSQQVVNPTVVTQPVGRGVYFEAPAVNKKYFFLSNGCEVAYSEYQEKNKKKQVRLIIKAGKKVKNTDTFLPFPNQPDSILAANMAVAVYDTTALKLNNIYLTNQYVILSRYSYLSSVTVYNTENIDYTGVYVSEICQSGHIIIRNFGKNATKDSMLIEGTFEAEVCRQVAAQTVVVDKRFNVFQGKFSLAFVTGK